MLSHTTTQASRHFKLSLESDLRDMADRFVVQVNERAKPAQLTLTRLINVALREYIETHPDTPGDPRSNQCISLASQSPGVYE